MNCLSWVSWLPDENTTNYGLRVAFGPPISVWTQPGLTEFTAKLFAPMAKDAMRRHGGGVVAGADNQFAAAQILERSLHGALGKAGRFCEHAQTCGHRFPFRARGLAIEMQINEISGRLSIVPDNVSHQDVEHVIVNRNGFVEARHFLKDEG